MKLFTRFSIVSFAATALLSLLLLVPLANARVTRVIAEVKGMACPFCAYGVEKKLKKVAGVKSIKIDIQKGMATLEAAAGQSISFDEVPKAIKDAGFSPDRIIVTAVGKITGDGGGQLVLRTEDKNKAFFLKDPKALAARYATTEKPVEVTGPISKIDQNQWTIQVDRVQEAK